MIFLRGFLDVVNVFLGGGRTRPKSAHSRRNERVHHRYPVNSQSKVLYSSKFHLPLIMGTRLSI